MSILGIQTPGDAIREIRRQGNAINRRLDILNGQVARHEERLTEMEHRHLVSDGELAGAAHERALWMGALRWLASSRALGWVVALALGAREGVQRL